MNRVRRGSLGLMQKGGCDGKKREEGWEALHKSALGIPNQLLYTNKQKNTCQEYSMYKRIMVPGARFELARTCVR